MIRLLYGLFILSGAAGLFYESVWTRYLSLFVGHGAYAQVIVLVIFLGGMAGGAALVSRWTERLRDPLYGYAVVEILVGLLGLVFHDMLYLPVTGWAYDVLFPMLGGGLPVLAAKWILAGLLILPQSLLLGATFPLMSAGVLRRLPGKPGTVLSWLYFSNSLGAAFGVLFAGFVLLGLAGLPGTVLAASIINLIVGLVALFISKATMADRPVAAPVQDDPSYPRDLDLLSVANLRKLLLLVSAGTAIASFIYEVAWIRLLSLVLGSATHSFELMLSAFILGLALGAFWIRKRAETIKRPLLVLAWVQVFMGVLAALSLVFYEWSFSWMATLMSAVGRTDQGYVLFSLARYAICLIIMLPATFCAGMTLPLITRTLLVAGSGERSIGAVYGANTLGSIIGVSIASLLLVPLLGLKGTLVLGATLDMVVGLAIGVVLHRHGGAVRQLLSRGALVTVLVPILVVVGVRLDRAMLSGGVFRTGHAGRTSADSVISYRDGRTATVSATATGDARLSIGTNGKPDGSLATTWLTACVPGDSLVGMAGDDQTQVLLALITLAHRPEARTAAVIGHGTGMSSHMLLASPTLESLVTIEIEREMIPASRVFYPANRRVFDDPRSVHVLDDAKSYFAAANTTFDLIMAEPSNPWVSGVSGLFTTEFYARVKRYLAPGGIMGQWLHTYELTDRLVLSVLAGIHQNFSDYAIYTVNAGDLLIVATPEGSLPAPDWGTLNLSDLGQDLCHFHPIRGVELAAARLSDRAALGMLLEDLVANSDFFPTLDLGAEQARFLGQSAQGIEILSQGVFDFAGPFNLPPILPDSHTISAIGAIPRIGHLVATARLLGQETAPSGDTAWQRDLRRDADQAALDWRRSLAGQAPLSWAVWSRAYWHAFRVWHAGTRGYLNPNFSRDVAGFLDRYGAPEPVRALVAFREGVAAHDWPRAVTASRLVVSEAVAGRPWVDTDDLREGAVLGWLAMGQPDSAAQVFQTLGRVSERSPDELRIRLLDSYLGRALQKP